MANIADPMDQLKGESLSNHQGSCMSFSFLWMQPPSPAGHRSLGEKMMGTADVPIFQQTSEL